MTTESYGYCSSWHNYTLYEPGLYKKGDCLKECLTLEVWHQCGCLPFYSPPLTYTKMMKPPFRTEDVSDYMFSNSLKRLKRYQWCSPTNGPCVKPVEKNGVGAEGTCSKRCPQPCQETKFSFLSSQSRFPTPEIMSKIRRTFNFTSNYSLKKARLNLISANFYFGSTVNTVEQIDIAMTWVDLLSQLGGALGLCIGASLLSLVEILAWLFWQFALLVRTLFRAAYCPEFAYEQKKYI